MGDRGLAAEAGTAQERSAQGRSAQGLAADPVGQPTDRPAGSKVGLLVDRVTFSRSPQQPILKACSLSVPLGEFWMLLGDNGCGKSTLMQLLAGLLQPESGRIALRRPVGFVFQNPDRQLVMPTVAADVAFALADLNLSQREIRDRVRSALDEVNLLDLERRPIYALSGGQKQRVAIAGAIAAHCNVLLLDEPTALLDPDSQRDLVDRVGSLVRDHRMTALWVTHRLEELDFADGAFLMEQGQIVAAGAPESLRDRLMPNASRP